jgi:hypothetical protein
MGLGVRAGEWSALPCGSAYPPAERDYTVAQGSNNTHTVVKCENPGGDAGGVRSSGTPGATMQRGRAAPRQLRANKQIDK